MKILFLIVFTISGAGQLNARSIHIVLQKYLEAVGGADKIRAIHSYYLNEVLSSTHEDTALYKVRQKITYYKAPYTRHEFHTDGRKVLIAYQFPRGVNIPGREKTYKIRDKVKVESMQSFDLLTQLGGVRYIMKAIEKNAIAFSDTVAIAGKRYYKFTATLQFTVNLYFNATTYRLERYDTGSGGYSVYSNFKAINGVLVPTVLTVHGTGNEEVSEKYELAMLDINTFIPEKYFPKRYVK